MENGKLILPGLVGVTSVAAANTALTTTFLLHGIALSSVISLLLFCVFWLLTSSVAVGVYLALNSVLRNRQSRRILSNLTEEPGKENLVESHGRTWGLTPSEIEVAIMVVKGFSNAEIANTRRCALPTVKSQLTSIYQKSGQQNRYQLIAFITDEICEISRGTLREKTAA